MPTQAALVGVRHHLLQRRITDKGLGGFDAAVVKDYRKKRPEILAYKHKLVMDRITPEMLAECSDPYKLGGLSESLHRQERAELGYASQTVETYAHILVERAESENTVKQIEAEILERKQLTQ